jgi:hypothetical protein
MDKVLRKKLWKELSEPKPPWEYFNRMLGSHLRITKLLGTNDKNSPKEIAEWLLGIWRKHNTSDGKDI